MRKGKSKFTSYAFLLPALIIYLSVIVIPVFYSLFISLTKWNGIGEMQFIGLKNYIDLFINDPIFLTAIKNNLIWILLTVLLTMTIALLLAVLMTKKFRGRTFFRGLFYLPCVIAPIAVSIIWRWVYNPNIGFINQFFKVIGIDYSQTWISDPKVSLYAIFVASLWASVGASMILFMAGLQGISSDIIEAAKIDGATGIRQFFSITIPLLKETFVIVIATLMVAALKVYDLVQGLTGGGPNNSTQMLSTYMYSQTFQYNNVGKGAAISCVMLFIMMFIIIPYVNFTAKKD